MWFIVPDMVGNGVAFWAINLEAAQCGAKIAGYNPAKVMADPTNPAVAVNVNARTSGNVPL